MAILQRNDGASGRYPFEKMQAIGNDFVVIDPRDWPDMNGHEQDWPALARIICDRHYGVGSDGLLLVYPSERADYRMRMFNPDGSEDNCGNGLRCSAQFVRTHLDTRNLFTFESISSHHTVQIEEFCSAKSLVRISMGAPRTAPAEVPLLAQREPAVDIPIQVCGEQVRVTCVNTGSTHTVIFADKPVDERRFQILSPALEIHPLFPERTSVMWAHVTGPGEIHIRIWERGVGETLGCGTGACAAAVAARLRGDSSPQFEVRSPGGTLRIEWWPGEILWMTGPACSVFSGHWPIR